MSRVQQGADAGSVESLEQGLVFILGSACRLYLGAGYTEKAVSIIQAVLEFHFFAPALSGKPRPLEPRELKAATACFMLCIEA